MLNLEGIKNILIVNTRASEKKLAGSVMWGSWAVASHFKRSIANSDVVLLDENNEDDFMKKFKEAVPSRDMVGFSISSMQIKYSLPLIRYIKENFPHIKVIIGGIHPILFPDDNYGKYIDEVITCDLPKDHFDYSFLPQKVKDRFRLTAQVTTGFNCSFKCAFCVNSVRNCRYEGMPIENIKADIEYVAREFNPRKIYFRDEDFFQDFDKAKAIIDYLLENNYHFKWTTNSRVTSFVKGRIDDEFLKRMVKSGCIQLGFGVESGSQRVLNYLRKGQTVDQIKFAVKQCCKYDIYVNASLLFGLPTETAGEREGTYKLIDELAGYGKKVQIFGPQMYRPYPGGLVYEDVKKYGIKLPENFEDWETFYDDGNNPLGDIFDTKVNYPWLTKKEKRSLPYVFAVAHYGLNYPKERRVLKKIIGYWFWWHWKLRIFDTWDIRLLMRIRKKYLLRNKIEDEL